ncbi:SufE family protein [Salipiger marinus]|uniref:SufE family protein n=1 Tax=Salipiger marinus TaxID=555512 RepID=UPI001E59A0F2|nr:SufE family protein [Salipiger manganoxidans]MCD1619399.1 SufE family protein [Salipiger manganoxidans]MEB3420232.1 SufE family protein [Salipiger manganoxidans]
MAQAGFEQLVGDFEFLEDWEDRYRMVIEMGRDMAALPEALKVPATKVEGCASQVWLHVTWDGPRLRFQGESDAMIVRGLIAVLHRLYDGLSAQEVLATDARAELGRLGLNEHLSAQRSNGLRAMVERIRAEADAA